MNEHLVTWLVTHGLWFVVPGAIYYFFQAIGHWQQDRAAARRASSPIVKGQ
jgi:hypothetical protein